MLFEAAAAVDWRASVLSGVSAGALATVVEILLWAACGMALPDTLFRDARFAAAIVMGRRALVPPATFDWHVMIGATVVHFSLSLVYTIVLAAAIGRLRVGTAMMAGAVFGLLLYAINMYGFTLLFPWFMATRDWITAAAHVIFGATAGAAYVVSARCVGKPS